MNREEILAAMRADVDAQTSDFSALPDGTIIWNSGEGGRERVIYVPRSAVPPNATEMIRQATQRFMSREHDYVPLTPLPEYDGVPPEWLRAHLRKAGL